jgi:purine-nucleoside phosphorylase
MAHQMMRPVSTTERPVLGTVSQMTTPSAPDPYEAAAAAAAVLAELTGVTRHDVAIVLGSGWVPAADVIGTATADFAVTELPGFPPPAAAGHAGRVRSIPVGPSRVLVFLGRTHLYEGRGPASVVHGVRTAVAAGCRTIVLTNGCGGLRPEYQAGQAVLISDHLNLTTQSPLAGARFVDLTDLYSSRLRGLAREVDPSLVDGVYAQLPGPHYETPAEIHMLRTLGADLVGMSTALEAIAAREAGAEVLGISLVTNLAAGMTGEPLNHQEVLAAGNASASRMGALLAQLLAKL